MHSISANYTLPTMLNTLKPIAASVLKKPASAAASSGTSDTASTSSSGSNSSAPAGIASTFLNLLAQELQNQDPTAPVDSTAMVGQMISLNQLDQLISINQGINAVSSAGTTGSAAPQATGATASNAALAAASAGAAGMLSPSVAGAATSQLPFDPNTLMPLSAGNTGAMAATINSSLNAANLGLSSTNNNTTGGK